MKKLVFTLRVVLFVPLLGTLVFTATAGATMYIPLILPELTADIRTFSGGSNYNSLFSGPGTTTDWIWNGVPFDLAEDSNGNTVYYSTTATSLTIPANVYGVTQAYTLINSAWGTGGVSVGKVEFYGSAGGYYEVDLVEGTNVRDHYNDGFENNIDGVTAVNAFTSQDGMDRLDMQIYNLPSSFATQTLTDIVFTIFAEGGGLPFIAAATVQETAGAITEFPVPTAGSIPGGITSGPDGNLWFTEGDGNKIGQITTAGAITEFPVPTAGSIPWGITSGPDGNLWFTEFFGNNIGRITTAGVITEFSIPTATGGPFGITWGPDGNLWFTEGNASKIGQVTPPAVNISVAPMSNDYGDVKVKRSKTVSFVVKNSGKSNLSITSSTITGADASMFKITSGGGSKTIKPAKNLTIKVAFKPTSTGSKSAILEIISNDPGTPTVDIPLSGTGQ